MAIEWFPFPVLPPIVIMVYGGHRGTSQLLYTCSFLLLASITVLLRLITRLIVLSRFGIDDALICVAIVRSKTTTRTTTSYTYVNADTVFDL